MPTPIVIPNACSIKVVWSGSNRSWLNTFGGLGAPVLPVIDQTVVDAVFSNLVSSPATQTLLGLTASTNSLASVKMRSLNQANLPEFTSQGLAVPGTGIGDTLPLNVAACITIRTAQAGRSFRGRTYFSGATEAQNDATGRITDAYNQACLGFITALNVALSPHAIGLAVLSPNHPAKTIPEKIIPAKTGFASAFLAAQARNTKWESQRRRTGRT